MPMGYDSWATLQGHRKKRRDRPSILDAPSKKNHNDVIACRTLKRCGGGNVSSHDFGQFFVAWVHRNHNALVVDQESAIALIVGSPFFMKLCPILNFAVKLA